MDDTIFDLEECFRKALLFDYNYIAVRIYMHGFNHDEIIINPLGNALDKLNYYKHAYNHDLTHKHLGDKIKIIDFAYGDSFDDIQEYFYSQ